MTADYGKNGQDFEEGYCDGMSGKPTSGPRWSFERPGSGYSRGYAEGNDDMLRLAGVDLRDTFGDS